MCRFAFGIMDEKMPPSTSVLTSPKASRRKLLGEHGMRPFILPYSEESDSTKSEQPVPRGRFRRSTRQNPHRKRFSQKSDTELLFMRQSCKSPCGLQLESQQQCWHHMQISLRIRISLQVTAAALQPPARWRHTCSTGMSASRRAAVEFTK